MTNNKSEQKKAPANQSAFDIMKAQNSDFTHEEIEDCDRALDDYLSLCREIYWDRVKDGTFPWPDEDSTL